MARLTLEQLSKSFGPIARAGRRFARGQRRRAGRDPRAVRLRQDDAAAADRGLRQARPRAHPDRRQRGLRDRSVTYRPSAGASASCSSPTRLWPHMSVAENVAYGLTVAGVAEPERARRVEAALKLVDLDGFADRAPGDAVGRAAAARRARPLPRHRAVARAARRAAGQSRRASARGHGTRVRALPRPHRHDHDLHHARPGRGDGARRSHRGDGATAACCSSPRRRSSIASRPTRRWRGSSAKAWWCPSTCATFRARSCVAGVFGHGVRLRCRAGQRVGAATACIRAEALRVVQRAAGGFAARVQSMTYEGGTFGSTRVVEGRRNVAAPVSSRAVRLCPGAVVELDVADGWVIPSVEAARMRTLRWSGSSRRLRYNLTGCVDAARRPPAHQRRRLTRTAHRRRHSRSAAVTRSSCSR